MPRGSHRGLWKPTPKDIFKSRWKKFYKRCYRPRSPANTPDHSGPHEQSRLGEADGVPSPWRLNYSTMNFERGIRGVSQKGSLPPDMRRYAYMTYLENVQRLLRPAMSCEVPALQDALLRSIDRGRRASCDSGYGRAETVRWPQRAEDFQRRAATPDLIPTHLYNIIESADEEYRKSAGRGDDSESFLDALKYQSSSETFVVRRLYELCEEKELVWEGQREARKSRGEAAPGSQEKAPVDRGRFPFVDEQASLIDELGLKEILRLRHRTNSRRHPKWKEVQYCFKKWHQQYLRRRHMNNEEVKERMGNLRKSLLVE